MYLTENLRKNIFLSFITIIAVALNYFESLVFIGGAFPGVKIGISNIVVLTVVYIYSYKEALLLSVFKSFFVTFLFGNGVSFLYSLLGGVFSTLGMLLLKKSSCVSTIGTSLVGSFIHITVQITVAFFILNSKTVFYYYPFMLFISTITGFINGFLVKLILPKIERRF